MLSYLIAFYSEYNVLIQAYNFKLVSTIHYDYQPTPLLIHLSLNLKLATTYFKR